MQLAGGNAVRSLFVFLDLLESQSECFAKLKLGNTAKGAKLSDVATDDNINRIWHFITLLYINVPFTISFAPDNSILQLQNSTDFFWALRYVNSLKGWQQTLNIRSLEALTVPVGGIGLAMSDRLRWLYF
ncbi:hypothetical protein CUJ84_Chr004923 [Rhizobium leguminosarum]|uniref:Uncharacterized protein n=1 Tax=Rhizobium leguminosarum TaxID=384 RepID=A0A2K9ZAC3_RHILE|nr:hypothetical protein CUJ84_Chr004923 [Rhizobium leguminosarum]